MTASTRIVQADIGPSRTAARLNSLPRMSSYARCFGSHPAGLAPLLAEQPVQEKPGRHRHALLHEQRSHPRRDVAHSSGVAAINPPDTTTSDSSHGDASIQNSGVSATVMLSPSALARAGAIVTTLAPWKPGRGRPLARAWRCRWTSRTIWSPAIRRNACSSSSGWKQSSPRYSTGGRSDPSASASTSPIWTTRRSRTASTASTRSATRRRPIPSAPGPCFSAQGARRLRRRCCADLPAPRVSASASKAAAIAAIICARSPKRVEVAEGEVRIMGSKSRLLQTLVANGGASAVAI